ncbi:hypothetical protein LOAG_14370, partial [Loa loa]
CHKEIPQWLTIDTSRMVELSYWMENAKSQRVMAKYGQEEKKLHPLGWHDLHGSLPFILLETL